MTARGSENTKAALDAWVRALALTAPIERDAARTLPAVIDALALARGTAPALIGSDSALSYRELAAAANRYARWGLRQGLRAGEVVCLLNDDTEVISGSWLTEMVSQLLQPRVGAVGAKLYYDDGTIQHAGVVLGVGGVAGHLYRRAAGDSDGQMGRLRLAQNLSAVTAACMVTRRRIWEQLGGLESVHLAVAFNDVDFCLRLRQAGWQVVWTPAAELIHHESVSRGTEKKRRSAFAAEERYMQERWGPALRRDPAYSPNLSLVVENGSLAWPPRVSYR